MRTLPARVRASSAALIGANALPVFGVVFWDWEVLSMLALYWAENVVIGGFNLLRLAVTPPYGVLGFLNRVFYGGFFCVHYGMFCWAHGAILFAIFGSGGHATDADFAGLTSLLASDAGLRIGVAMLALSHLFSFAGNFLLGGEFRATTTEMQFWRPYGRILVLHLVILLGGFLAQATHSYWVALLMLAALKTTFDLRAHWREHTPRPPPAPVPVPETPP